MFIMRLKYTKSIKNYISVFIILIGVFGYGQEDPFNFDNNKYKFQNQNIEVLD